MTQKAPKQDKDTQQLIHLYKNKDYVAMETLARQVVSKKPWHLFAKRAIAAALSCQRRYSEAVPLLEILVKERPGDWEMWTNLGDARRTLGDVLGAINALETVLRIRPDHGPAMIVLAEIYQFIQEPQRALDYTYAALQNEPGNRECFIAWVTALRTLGHFEQVVDCLRQAWEEDKDDPELAVLMVYPARGICDWCMAEEGESVFLQRHRAGYADNFPPLHMVATRGFDRLDQKLFMERRLQGLEGQSIYLEHERDFSLEHKERPLRIGYLSGDIHAHATVFLIAGVFEQHKEAGLELYVYSNGPEDSSTYRQRVIDAATAFRNVRLFSVDQLAEQMVQDQIDILVDLKGWTKDYDAALIARKPAPVTVAWLGYPGTIGHPKLADYIIGDPVVTPLEHADGYTETLALMPHCYQPNDNSRPIASVPVRAEVGLPDDAFVFCTFARSDKYTPDMFAVWCDLLKGTPGSVLWLWEQNPTATQNILKAVTDYGIAPERVVFACGLPSEEHLARLSLADLALDTFPYTSHTTGSDALWAGVPLLAMRGETFASRVSASLVRAVGLPELAVGSYEEYRALGLALANGKRDKLIQMTEHLRANKKALPLFDTQQFTRDLARLYRQMWEAFLDGKREPIVLEADESDKN